MRHIAGAGFMNHKRGRSDRFSRSRMAEYERKPGPLREVDLLIADKTPKRHRQQCFTNRFAKPS
jgi:hypothetical protein